ncbi:MAG: phospholipase [Vicinamibacteraceae bacterium]
MPAATVHTIGIATHGRYLVRAPATAPARVAVVGFHGYGQRAQHLLDELEALPGADACLLVSVQGLHRFYERATQQVVAHWMTSEDRELAIADNIAYVDAVVAAVASTHAFERLVFLGFSQGASMASRAAAHAGDRCHGLILLGGDVAPEVLASGARLPRTIIGRGTTDAFYSARQFTADSEALEERGALAAAFEFTGGHEFTPTFRAAAGALIQAL